MVARSLIPRLTDIVEAIERIDAVLENVSLEVFEADWQRQWLVERGVEIISEASRHLTDEMNRLRRSATCCATTMKTSLRPSYGSWRKPIYQRWKKVCRVELDVEGRPGRSS